jgi:RNA polymerase-binding transcription factor DksA
MSATTESEVSTEFHREMEAVLHQRRAACERRLEKIQVDRRRERGPLDPDFEEQATQRENDETLDALDARGRQDLEAIVAALDRIWAGSYGCCVRCNEAIPMRRLRARPEAIECLGCTSE